MALLVVSARIAAEETSTLSPPLWSCDLLSTDRMLHRRSNQKERYEEILIVPGVPIKWFNNRRKQKRASVYIDICSELDQVTYH